MIRRAVRALSVMSLFAQVLACTILVACLARTATAQDVRTYIPTQAAALLPLLRVQQEGLWPAAPEPWTLAGQVEQESCITLKHPKCWNPHAELKTSREYGFGLGQTTIAYDARGAVRFNNFELLKQQHRELAGWKWDDRYSANYQLQAFVLMTRDGFERVRDAASPRDHWAFALAGYNGGAAGTLKDRLLCQNTAACDSRRWFGNVERTSLKSRLVPPGYGASAFAINRNYPQVILGTRRDKYQPFWSD